MAGEYTNKKVGRLIAAGSRTHIDDVVSVISRLNAIHINEYADDQEGFSLGTPSCAHPHPGAPHDLPIRRRFLYRVGPALPGLGSGA